MKKYTVIISFLFLGLLASCSKSDEGPNNGIDKSANLLATGASANDILSNNTFSKLLIEIAYVQNFRPTQEAMDDFETYLRDRTFKQDIEVTYLQLPSPNEENLSLQEIANLEDENRTAYNEGETLAIYIYFADVSAEGDKCGKPPASGGCNPRISDCSTVANLASSRLRGHLFPGQEPT